MDESTGRGAAAMSEKRILVMSAKKDNNRKEIDRRKQIHLVDLEHHKIDRDIAPSISAFTIQSSMVSLKNSVYMFGGRLVKRMDDIRERLPYDTDTHTHTDDIYVGGSRFRLSSRTWSHVFPPPQGLTKPTCAVFSGKIYNFGEAESLLAPEVFDPSLGRWNKLDDPLPPHLAGCRVAKFALPDLCHARILVQLYDGPLPSPCLYAFFPLRRGESRWQPMAHGWAYLLEARSKVAAVQDGVVYIHNRNFPQLIRAYDVDARIWVVVNWDSAFEKDGDDQYTNFPADMANSRMEFDGLFPLAPGVMCFAFWTRHYLSHLPPRTIISFPKFRVQRCSASKATFFPISCHTYLLPSTYKVAHILPV